MASSRERSSCDRTARGNDVPRVHYKLDGARQLTKLMPAPIPLGNGQAVESLDQPSAAAPYTDSSPAFRRG